MIANPYTWCMTMCMRTNIILNDSLVAEAMKYTHAPSRRALVDEALRTLIQVRAAAQRSATYRQQAADIQARTAGLMLRERPSSVLRADRARA